MRHLQPEIGLGARLIAAQRLQVGARGARELQQAGQVRARIRRRDAEAVLDVERRFIGPAADKRQQLQARLGQRQFCGLDGASILQHGHARPRDFKRRNRAARQPPLVQLHQAVERLQVVARQLQLALGFKDVDAGERYVKLQAADRVSELRFGGALRRVGNLRAQLAFVRPLERHIDAKRIFGRPGRVQLVEPGAEPVEAVGPSRQHGIRPQARRDPAGFGNGQICPVGEQSKVLLNRFVDGLFDRQRPECAVTRGGRRKHEQGHGCDGEKL